MSSSSDGSSSQSSSNLSMTLHELHLDYQCEKVYKTVASQDPQFRAKPRKDRRIWFIIGDGSFMHNSRGFITVPSGTTMLQELRKLGESVYFIDEFRTSMCCSCGEKLVSAVNRPSIKKTKHWALKQCLSRKCNGKLWNRDFNACRNFHAIVRALLNCRDRPPYLQRQPRATPAIVNTSSSSSTSTKRAFDQTNDLKSTTQEPVFKKITRSGQQY